MSSIGPGHRVAGTDPTRPDQSGTDQGRTAPHDDDAFADAGGGGPGGGRHFGGYGGGAGHGAGGRADDPAASHGPGEPAAGDGAQQAELARRAGDFRRSLHAAMAKATGDAATGEAASRRESGDTGRDAGREGGGPDAGDGMSGFAQLFARHGRDEGGRDAPRARQEERATREHETAEQVLAASSPAAGSTLPLFPALQPVQEPAGQHGQAIAGAVEERVAQAIRAELAGQSAATGAVSIDLTGLVDGLAAITVRMSATGLDVVLSGSLDLGPEAQALADRLSRRFGNRGVRILTAPADDGRTTEHDQADGDGDGRAAPVARRTGDTA